MTSNAILLVEGESDQKFFATLLKSIALPVSVQPETPKSVSDNIFRNGINPLLTRFEKEVGRLLLGSSVQQLAIVIDADQQADGHGFNNRRKQITDVLEKACVTLSLQSFNITSPPIDANQGELFTHPSGAQVGLWIMPDHRSEGMLEDFLIHTIQEPTQQQLLQIAQKAVADLGTQRLFKPTHEMKANLSTWLAWQDPPGLSTAYAYHKALFNQQHSNIQALTHWLQQVFQ